MKRAIRLIAALLGPSLLMWLLVGFVTWNWNLETWSESQRAYAVIFSLAFTVPLVACFWDIP